jgi:peptide methionine sulfoxide reductase MsrA
MTSPTTPGSRPAAASPPGGRLEHEWPGKVVTEVAPAGPFWEAEPEHQDYLQRYPDGYTCHFVRPGWKLPHRADAR